MDQFQQLVVLRNIVENAKKEVRGVGGLPKRLRLKAGHVEELDNPINVRDKKFDDPDGEAFRIAPPWFSLARNRLVYGCLP
jgi:hypothetical protein